MAEAAGEVDVARLVDHHCHGLVVKDLDRPAFEALMNEAPGPGSTPFDSMLGLAMRRWCAPVLGLEALAPAEVYLTRRADLGGAEASRRLVSAAGIDTFLVDTGLVDAGSAGGPLCTPAELAAMGGGSAREVVRLERVAEEVLEAGLPAEGFAEAVVARLRAASPVAAKSVAAYRVGLRLPETVPSSGALAAAVSSLEPDARGRHRLAHPVVNGWLAWTAVELGLPLQVHVGYGDPDLDLREADPLLLTGFLRATEARGTPVLLLHNYPYHRNAAYLCQVFRHAFMDLGLATHNTGALSERLLRETLELVPFGKLLFSSDAYGLAEHYLLASRLSRRALARVLGDLVDDGDLTPADAAHVAALVASDNARRVYRLG